MTTAEPIENATVVIADGRIASVSRGAKAPSGAHIVDADGAIVTPGLFNAASHLGLVEVGSLLDEPPAGSEFESLEVEYALDPNSTLLPLARADGVSRAAVFPPRADGRLVAGTVALLRLSEGADILEQRRAGVFISIGEVGANKPAAPRAAQWPRLGRLMRAASRSGDSTGETADKSDHEGLDAVVARKAALVVQAGREGDLRQAIDLGREEHVRVIIFGGAEAWRVAGALAEAAIPVILNPFDNLPASFDAIGARLDNAAELRRAGVQIAFAATGIHLSHNAGLALREAAGVAVANGLPWIEALRALTTGPATIWGIDDHYGTLREGFDADLVVWDGDPLDPRSAATTVIVRGEVASLVTRQSQLAERHHPKHRQNPWPPSYR